jgi:hypothetical protein
MNIRIGKPQEADVTAPLRDLITSPPGRAGGRVRSTSVS